MPQTFHQQSLGRERGRLFLASSVEIDLEIAGGPEQHLVDGFIADQRVIDRVVDLAFREVTRRSGRPRW